VIAGSVGFDLIWGCGYLQFGPDAPHRLDARRLLRYTVSFSLNVAKIRYTVSFI